MHESLSSLLLTNTHPSSARFNAYGTTQVPQECKDVTETNPDWQMGQIYSSRTVTCDVVDLTIKPYEMTAVA